MMSFLNCMINYINFMNTSNVTQLNLCPHNAKAESFLIQKIRIEKKWEKSQGFGY